MECYGQYELLSSSEKDSIEERCKDETFSTCLFILPSKFVKAHYKSPFNDSGSSVSIQEIQNNMCSLKNVISNDRNYMKKLELDYNLLADVLIHIKNVCTDQEDTYSGGAMFDFISKLSGENYKRPEYKTSFLRHIYIDKKWCDRYRCESSFEFNGQNLVVFIIGWNGSQKCPFQSENDTKYNGYEYGAEDIIVTNTDNGKILTYSSLLPHMIKNHGFLGGPNCLHRLNPQKVIDVLGNHKTWKISMFYT
jgi:hypothetical protein